MKNWEYYWFIIAFLMVFSHNRFFNRRWKISTLILFTVQLGAFAGVTWYYLATRTR